MNIEMPDVLGKVDRTQGVAASVNAVSSMPSVASTDAAAAGTAHRRVEESFGQVLNRNLVKKGVDAESSADTAKSFAELLNGREAMIQEDENDLNHRRKATVNDGKMGADETEAAEKAVAERTKPGMMGPAQRLGETANQAVNRKRDADPAADRHAQVEKGAEGLVANALILPVLKQLRRSKLAENSVFSGGNGEKTFGPEFDMELADRIAQSPRLAVKDALVRRMESRPSSSAAPGKQGRGFHASAKEKTATTRIDVNG